MKVLVIAQDAQVRDALVTQFDRRDRSYHCVDGDWLAALDGTAAIPGDIGIVINAITLEQLAEPNGNISLENIERLADACKHANVGLFHISGSQVFDGIDGGGRHREDDKVNPASQVGAALVKAEQIITERCSRHIVLRTGLLFSGVGENVLTSLLAQFQQKKTLVVSSIGTSCPIHTADLARVISGMIDQLSCGGEVWGLYHYHSSEPVNRFKFSEVVLAAVSQLDETLAGRVKLKSSKEIDPSWFQPLLNCEKVLNTFGIKQLPWRPLVVQTIKQLVSPAE